MPRAATSDHTCYISRMWPLLVTPLLVACQGTGDPAVAPPTGPAPSEVRPNVLVVVWDTVRADRLGLYGHSRPTTPKLDALAAESRVFERAISPGMWTVPSHGSLFTGLPVASHGANAKWIWLDERFVTLAEHLGANGFETWAWSANPYLSEATNLLQGFGTVHTAWDGAWAERAGHHTMDKRLPDDASVELGPAWTRDRHTGWPAHLVAYKDAAPVAREALVDWLEHRDPAKPWLAYVNLMEAHHPRLPSKEARERLLTPDEVQAGLTTDGSLFRLMAAMEGEGTFSEPELAALRGVYDAALGELDAATGELLDVLRARGELDRTVVIVVSDHGEHLGEHGMFDHRWSVWQELLWVPLVVRYPAAVAPGRVTEPVSTQQLFPTVCELARVPCPTLPVGSLLGPAPPRVFSELLQPTPRLAPVKQRVVALDPDRWKTRYQVVVEGDWKLIRASDLHHGLYDLRTDPHEATNRWSSDPAVGAGLLAAARDWQATIAPYDPLARAPGDAPRPALVAGPGTAEQLRLLGYTEGGAEEAP